MNESLKRARRTTNQIILCFVQNVEIWVSFANIMQFADDNGNIAPKDLSKKKYSNRISVLYRV